MLTANELITRLTDIDFIRIIESLGSELIDDSNEKYIVFTTQSCHGGDSNKLYFFRDTKYFHCYTQCGQLSLFDILKNNKEYEIYESINYICNLLNISTSKVGFGIDTSNRISDWKFINNLKRKRNSKTQTKEINIYNDNILNIFQDIYTSEWLDDGISVESMQQFNIKYSTLQQKIIIPHYDINSNLIGVRGRSVIEEEVEEFGKYTPFQLYGKMYNHPLGQNLYGIHMNKNCIKRKRKVMLVESEKGVLQCSTMFGIDDNFTLGLCGNKITKHQRDLLIQLEVNEVIVALDKQYEIVNGDEYNLWLKHMQDKILSVISPYFKVYVIWDTSDLLGYKESPTDKDRGTLMTLMKNKIYIPS